MPARLRLTELSLIVFPCAWVLTGFLLIALAREHPISFQELMPALVFVALLGVTYVALVALRLPGDQLLVPLTAALTGLGIVFVRRLAGPEYASRQSLWMAVGVGAMLATIVLLKDTRKLRHYKYTWLTLGLLLIAATFVLGKASAPGGPRLWINLGMFTFQPSEALKVIIVVFFASYLSEHYDVVSLGRYRLGRLSLPPLPHLMPLVIMWGLAATMMAVQRDMGAAFLLFGIFLAMLYVASGRLLYVGLGLVAFAAASYVGYHTIAIVQQRFDLWLDPWSQAGTGGYQIVQGLIALGAGGSIGSGLAYGMPGYIPAVFTDFVFSAIGEEMGLLGTIGVLILYLFMVHRGFRIALSCRDSFHQLLAAGLTTVLGLQTVIILAGTLKLIPLTGITLPFISYGGSSLLTNFVIIGMLLRISASEQRAPSKTLDSPQ